VLERDACDVQARVYIYVCVCVCLCVYLCVCLYGGMVLPDPTAKGECKALLKEYTQPYFLSKEVTLRTVRCSRKRPILYLNPIFYQKNPVFYQLSLCLSKE